MTSRDRSAFVLIGDNRSGNNWGGRASGLALSDLLRAGLGSGRSVFGSELADGGDAYGYRSLLLPRSKYWLARSLRARATRNPLIRGMNALDRWLGAGDFLDPDPETSVRNLVRRRSADPGLQELYKRVSEADTVVINGEGDIVFSHPFRRQVLFFAAMVRLARHLGKRVVLVNTMLSDGSPNGRDPAAFSLVSALAGDCHLVSVRDGRSLQVAREEMGISGSLLVPDAVFHWYKLQERARAQLPECGDFVISHPERDAYLGRLDLSGDYICLGGNSVITQPGSSESVRAAYRRLCDRLRRLGLPLYLVVADGRDQFLEEIAEEMGLGVVPLLTPIHLAAAILGRARLFISGRYHPSIMASLGGTPCLFLRTPTHKMQSLSELLEADSATVFSSAPEEEEAEKIYRAARERLEGGEVLRARIQARAESLSRETAGLGGLIRGKLVRTEPVVSPAELERHVV